MKKSLLIAAVLLSMNSFAQTQKQLEKVTSSTCDCLQDKVIEAGNMNQIQMELGVCMLAAMGENNISLDVGDQAEIESFGERVGAQLAYTCPKFLSLLGEMAEEDPDAFNALIDDMDEPAYEISNGTVIAVQSEDFVTLKIQNDSGRKETFYWFEYFEGSDLLENGGKAILQKSVYIEYETIEVYSPKIEDYTDVKVLRVLSFD